MGPRPGEGAHARYAEEVLPISPSNWYLTGFLVPYEAPLDQRSDDDADDELDQASRVGAGDDENTPEQASARKAFFPSSIGLSVLVSQDTAQLQVKVAWGDYAPVVPGDDEDEELSVQLFLNVERKYGDQTADAVLLREFADKFRGQVWPGERLPTVYYDPRSLSAGGKTRACLHAKCIVADKDRALVSSANFTEAAHERNIEAGLLITDRQVAMALRAQFDTLVERGVLRRVPGLPGPFASSSSPRAC